ncbi:hypothetical protein [Deinococcus koreensis]|nr:hypothetical protein [Deinococcus koreensis]
MKRLLVLCALLTPLAAAQQSPTMERTTDIDVVLALMKGRVDLYGDRFGSVQFQRGMLTLLHSKTITVRVLTTLKSAPNMKPLKALGAQVNTLPSSFTGSMVIVQGRAVILPLKHGGYAIMRGPTEAAQTQGLMELYWRYSSPY